MRLVEYDRMMVKIEVETVGKLRRPAPAAENPRTGQMVIQKWSNHSQVVKSYQIRQRSTACAQVCGALTAGWNLCNSVLVCGKFRLYFLIYFLQRALSQQFRSCMRSAHGEVAGLGGGVQRAAGLAVNLPPRKLWSNAGRALAESC